MCCGSHEFIRRPDDNEADGPRAASRSTTGRRRRLIAYYGKKGKLRTVDGMADIPDVRARSRRC